MKNIAIIGGGAAGLTAAISAAEQGATVTIYEKNDRVGKKILVTGNGRCNLSNLNVNFNAYNQPEFTKHILEKYNCDAIRDFFESIGLWTYADDEGRVYPLSDMATSVLDVLRLKCSELNVGEQCQSEIVSITKNKDKFAVTTADGHSMNFNSVIVTTGGKTTLLKTAGHKYVSFKPVLCPLKTEMSAIRGLSGIRVACSVSLIDKNKCIAKDKGELLFRDYGVSGVVIFDMSRIAKAGQTLSIDFMPEIEQSKLIEKLNERKKNLPLWQDSEFFTGIFHKRIGQAILKTANSSDIVCLASTIKDFKIKIIGVGEEKQAQVTAGGADVSQFDCQTMQSKQLKGIFAAGEALDIDGKCGGYNLHWAFASGLTAGYFAANEVM